MLKCATDTERAGARYYLPKTALGGRVSKISVRFVLILQLSYDVYLTSLEEIYA
jgi:hypothetical protein